MISKTLFRTRVKKGGFSLVEVTLALGLVSFVLVALLGLASTGLDASKHSAEDTSLVQVAEQAFSTGLDPLSSGASVDMAFTHEGIVATDPADTYYSATLSAEDPQNASDNTGALFFLKLTISWPGGTKIFHGSAVARK